jgi:hypothetical protein
MQIMYEIISATTPTELMMFCEFGVSGSRGKEAIWLGKVLTKATVLPMLINDSAAEKKNEKMIEFTGS